MKHQPRILCVHQGGELYGSDRIFLQAVSAIRDRWPASRIRVVLAAGGPLVSLLEEVADEVAVRSLSVMRLANPVSTVLKNTIAAPYFIGRAAADIAASDMTYINTTVISDYMLAARLFSSKCVIHAHEIPKAKAMPVIRFLVRWSNAKVVMNSLATARAFALPEFQQTELVYNGAGSAINPHPPEIKDGFDAKRPLRLAMLGRISHQKAQDLLIDAVASLKAEDQKRIRLRIIGGVYLDRPEPLEALQDQICAAGLQDIITLEPFTDTPGDAYRWADICVIPSRLPESFGMVAIEAMAEARPVIASAHGGPVEIVIDGETGWLVIPDDADDLAEKIRFAIYHPEEVKRRGAASLDRFEKQFSSDSMARNLGETLSAWFPLLDGPAT